MTGDRMTCAEALDVARRWAARGVPAFPIAIGSDDHGTRKRPLTDHGHHDATTDPADLERLFNARGPKPGEAWGVGLLPGKAGCTVVDVDVKADAGGDDTWAALRAEHGHVDTYTVTTASGGLHVWGRKGDRHIGNAHQLGPGIDVRGDDGWVVAPGTRTPWGTWAHEHSSPRWPPAPWPGWVLDRLDPASSSGAASGRVGHWCQLDRSTLHPADLAALEALERLGGHDPYMANKGDQHYVMVARPGKTAAGVSIGFIGPGVVKVKHRDWWPLRQEAVYDADQLQAIAEAVEAGDKALADQLADPNDLSWARPEQPRNGTATGLTLVPASTIVVARPEWVWEGRIPIGGTTLGAGREGQGKTALACWVMARLTRGQLPGRWLGHPVDVVFIGTEDDRATVLVPRLTAAGADLTRVHFLDVPAGATFSVTADAYALADTLRGHEVGLVTLDPLDGHLGGVDSHRKAEVQAAVAKLAVLSQELRCGVWGLGHLNKGDVRDILARVVGSVGFTTSVRSVLGIGEHPDEQNDRVCVVAKANMTDKTAVPAMRFRVEGTVIDDPAGGPPIDTGLAVMLGEELGVDPNAVIDSGTPAERSAVEEAVVWLNDVLGDGPQDAADVKKWAKAADISERTLHRARNKVGVKVTRRESERGRPSVWELQGFHANGFVPTPPGTKPTHGLTSGNGDGEGVSCQTPGSGTKPDYDGPAF